MPQEDLGVQGDLGSAARRGGSTAATHLLAFPGSLLGICLIARFLPALSFSSGCVRSGSPCLPHQLTCCTAGASGCPRQTLPPGRYSPFLSPRLHDCPPLSPRLPSQSAMPLSEVWRRRLSIPVCSPLGYPLHGPSLPQPIPPRPCFQGIWPRPGPLDLSYDMHQFFVQVQ